MALAYQLDAGLMEMELPELGGCEVARHLREREGCQRTLLVAVTGHGGKRHRRLTQDAGFDLHLLKPVCPEVLREVLLNRIHDSQEERK